MNADAVARADGWSRIALVVAVAALAGLLAATPAVARSYQRPPVGLNQWYWEIGPPEPGLAGLPEISAPYPEPGSATIWDTDLFQDSNRAGARVPGGGWHLTRADSAGFERWLAYDAHAHAGKPVLDAEYTQDGETTARFCAADLAAGITGALFDVNLGGKTYRPCAQAGRAGR